MAKPLNPRQLKFVELYLLTGRAAESYIAAGYSARGRAATVCAAKLLTNANVEAALNAARKVAEVQSEVNATWLFARVKREAESDGEFTSHGARVSALTLAARLLGLLTDKVDVAVSGKTAEMLATFRQRYNAIAADDAPADS